MKVKLKHYLSGVNFGHEAGTILDEKDFTVASLKKLVAAGLAEETTVAKSKPEKATAKKPTADKATKKPPAKKE